MNKITLITLLLAGAGLSACDKRDSAPRSENPISNANVESSAGDRSGTMAGRGVTGTSTGTSTSSRTGAVGVDSETGRTAGDDDTTR